MIFNADPDTIAHAIQLAIAPVFLLNAVAGMIGAVTTRLARIIDRARVVEARIESLGSGTAVDAAFAELASLRKRGLLVNSCIGLLTLCAFMVGLTIIVLFLGETTAFAGLRLAIGCFLISVIGFLLALGCFMAETLISTDVLNFKRKLP